MRGNSWIKGARLALAAALAMATAAGAMEFGEKDGVLTFRTKRMEVEVRDARIVGVKSLGGTILAGGGTPYPSITAGLGNMTGREAELSKAHFPWGDALANPGAPLSNDSPLAIYRAPSERTRLDVQEKDGTVTAVWSGLSNGTDFFPGDSIAMTFRADANGALEMTAAGQSAEKGVFGIQIPIENLDGGGQFVIPSFGGLEYDAASPKKPSIMTFSATGLYYEAQLMTYTLGGAALGYWFEDATFRPYFAFLGRGEKAANFGFEINTLIPFEARDGIAAPTFKLDVFDDADWIAAARPYRDWYRAAFAADIAQRDSIPWAEAINAISDTGVPSAEVLRRIASFMDPAKVLLQVWQARKEGFTTNIPDYTLREKYPAEVSGAHEHGFKVMCYVCSLCAVYKSPAWDRDNVGDFFLTRKNSISKYNEGKTAFDENVDGNITAAAGADQFARLKPGALLYGDPLSAGWRKYFTGLVVKLNRESGTDANYQDTLGVITESGNGVIDGLSGAQGNAALVRELRDAMPETPMASEFGPASIAFAVKWPLNYASAWGGKEFRKYRMNRQRPLTAFVLGYRPWVPSARTAQDFHKHVVAAVSDSISGMGMFAAAADMDVKSGFADHLVLRSKIFIDNSLVPHYPERKYPEGVVAMYKDAKGGIYHYRVDGGLQTLLDPDGKPLYGRVGGVSSLKTGLKLPGWPAYDRDGLYGLDPERSYALFPEAGTPPEFNFGRIPENAALTRYYAAEDFAYAEFAGAGKAEIDVKAPARFVNMLANDMPAALGAVSGELPLRLAFFSGKTVPPGTVRKIDITGNGMERGAGEPLPASRRTFAGEKLYRITGYNAKSLDAVFRVEHDDEAIEFMFVNTQERHGDGSVVTALVNGNPVASFDCLVADVKRLALGERTPPVFDAKLRKWSVPVGRFKGREILFTVRSDSKASTNADSQWISLPEITRGAKQEFSETFPE